VQCMRFGWQPRPALAVESDDLQSFDSVASTTLPVLEEEKEQEKQGGRSSRSALWWRVAVFCGSRWQGLVASSSGVLSVELSVCGRLFHDHILETKVKASSELHCPSLSSKLLDPKGN
jgi:hypothetical protein